MDLEFNKARIHDILFFKRNKTLGIVAYTFNPSTQEAEKGIAI